jgi:hypothetical protein
MSDYLREQIIYVLQGEVAAYTGHERKTPTVDRDEHVADRLMRLMAGGQEPGWWAEHGPAELTESPYLQHVCRRCDVIAAYCPCEKPDVPCLDAPSDTGEPKPGDRVRFSVDTTLPLSKGTVTTRRDDGKCQVTWDDGAPDIAWWLPGELVVVASVSDPERPIAASLPESPWQPDEDANANYLGGPAQCTDELQTAHDRGVEECVERYADRRCELGVGHDGEHRFYISVREKWLRWPNASTPVPETAPPDGSEVDR